MDNAIHFAIMRAMKNMVPIMLFENRTVYRDLEAKFGATKVTLRWWLPGFEIRTNFYIEPFCRCAGIKDLFAKVHGSANRMNIVKAVFEALRLQKLPDTIVKQRGKHVIDVRDGIFMTRKQKCRKMQLLCIIVGIYSYSKFGHAHWKKDLYDFR